MASVCKACGFHRRVLRAGAWRAWAAGLLLCALLGGAGPAAAQSSIETAAEYVYMVDHETGTVLLSKGADEPFPPASMAKLMTLEVVFEAIGEGRLSLDDMLFVSEYAWRTGGAPSGTATMFAEVTSEVSVADLLRGIMVQAANDACIVLAEGLAGSEEAFAVAMNQRAEELGLTNSRFVNSTGFPAEGQHTTARDLVRLSRHLIEAHPELYRTFSQPEFTWNGIRQLNRNPLATSRLGVDGLMAGSDEETGYGMAASAVQQGQRLIAAAHGMPSANARSAEVQKLLSWGFRAFEKVQLFAAGEVVGDISVYGGDPGRVALTSDRPIEVLVPKGTGASLRGRIVYMGPLRAPVSKGDRVGHLRVQDGEKVIGEIPLHAADSVGVAPLYRQALDAALELVIGLVHSGVEAASPQ